MCIRDSTHTTRAHTHTHTHTPHTHTHHTHTHTQSFKAYRSISGRITHPHPCSEAPIKKQNKKNGYTRTTTTSHAPGLRRAPPPDAMRPKPSIGRAREECLCLLPPLPLPRSLHHPHPLNCLPHKTYTLRHALRELLSLVCSLRFCFFLFFFFSFLFLPGQKMSKQRQRRGGGQGCGWVGGWGWRGAWKELGWGVGWRW